ncbi:hypothetical protein BK011_08795 [Tenericutes bacterium MZ-XQ]|nr:hypothetical protein BK011_08795 [Tenericutes bacterium MZ-XQ]
MRNDDILRKLIEDGYGIDINHIELFRDMIGRVYLIKTQEQTYMFKIYRKNNTASALVSLNVMRYIDEHKGPVPKVYLTLLKEPYVVIDDEIGILYEYINGEQAEKVKHEKLILQSIFEIHQIMKSYPYELTIRDHSFFIDRYIHLLKEVSFNNQRLMEMKMLGAYFFNVVDSLDKGFYHGDMHTGNIIINKDHRAIIFDFDACGILSPLVDYITFFDQTHFNQFHEVDLMKTIDILKQQNFIDSKLIKHMLAMIPVRHFEIIATIFDAQGLDDQAETFFEEQYHWMMAFYKSYQNIKV